MTPMMRGEPTTLSIEDQATLATWTIKTAYVFEFMNRDVQVATKEELHYEVKMPLHRKNNRLSDMILKLDPENHNAIRLRRKLRDDGAF